MRIRRSGANRYSGQSTIGPARLTPVFWEAGSLSLNISMSGVTDPGKDGMYNYQVNLDLTDIAAILGELADRGLAHSPSEIAEGLAGATRALYRLQATSDARAYSTDRRHDAPASEATGKRGTLVSCLGNVVHCALGRPRTGRSGVKRPSPIHAIAQAR